MSQSTAGATVESSPGLWGTLREAVRGSHQDYTQAPVGRAVILLAVPMVLEMLMESVFAVADIFFVGRLGADAVARPASGRPVSSWPSASRSRRWRSSVAFCSARAGGK